MCYGLLICLSIIYQLKIKIQKAWEIAQWLRVLIALAEDQSFFPSTHQGADDSL